MDLDVNGFGSRNTVIQHHEKSAEVCFFIARSEASDQVNGCVSVVCSVSSKSETSSSCSSDIFLPESNQPNNTLHSNHTKTDKSQTSTRQEANKTKCAARRKHSTAALYSGATSQKILKRSLPEKLKTPPVRHNTVYEVEHIVTHEVLPGSKVCYYVKWKGWSSGYNTWEPLSNLSGCQELIKDYYDRLYEIFVSSEVPSAREVEKFASSLVDTKREVLEGLMSTLMTDGLVVPAPIEEDIQKQLRVLVRLKESNRNPIDMEGIKRNLLLRALHLNRTQQLSNLKKWEIEMNRVSNTIFSITVENDVDLEGPPENFTYINDYIPGKGITIPEDPPVGCSCRTCDGRSRGCCSTQFKSDFAYSANGLLKVRLGTPIYECNKRCKCGHECSNRVVQNGSFVELCIFRTSNGCGWGVKALQDIRKGTFLCEYVGEVIHNDEAESRGRANIADGRTYLFDLDFNDQEQCLYTVDATTHGNIAHFINHSCRPNLGVYAVWINCLDPNLPKLALFAIHNIKAGDEVTFDYVHETFKQQPNDPGLETSSSMCVQLAVTDQGARDSRMTSRRVLCKCRSKHCKQYLF